MSIKKILYFSAFANGMTNATLASLEEWAARASSGNTWVGEPTNRLKGPGTNTHANLLVRNDGREVINQRVIVEFIMNNTGEVFIVQPRWDEVTDTAYRTSLTSASLRVAESVGGATINEQSSAAYSFIPSTLYTIITEITDNALGSTQNARLFLSSSLTTFFTTWDDADLPAALRSISHNFNTGANTARDNVALPAAMSTFESSSSGGPRIIRYIVQDLDNVQAALTAGTASSSSVAATTATISMTVPSGGYPTYRQQLQQLIGATWTDVSGKTALSNNVTGLVALTEYSWRFKVTDNNGGETYSNTVTFTTADISGALAASTFRFSGKDATEIHADADYPPSGDPPITAQWSAATRSSGTYTNIPGITYPTALTRSLDWAGASPDVVYFLKCKLIDEAAAEVFCTAPARSGMAATAIIMASRYTLDPTTPLTNHERLDGKTYVIVGSSTMGRTYGNGKDLPTMMTEDLAASGSTVTFINKAVTNMQWADFLPGGSQYAALLAVVGSSPVFIVQLGSNNAGVSTNEQFEDLADDFIAEWHTLRGRTLWFVEYNPRLDATPYTKTDQLIDFNAIMASKANGTTIKYLAAGTFPYFASNLDQIDTSDNIHLTTAGALNEARFVNQALADAEVPLTVATPVINPATGSYTSAQVVEITCATTGATIRYTTDGSTPTAGSPAYSGSFTLSATATVKAKAFKSGYNDSAEASRTYTITLPTVATPTFSPPAGTYDSAQSVSILCATSDVTIHYTLDGTTPTTSSPVYSTPISVSESKTLKAIAVKALHNNSAVGSAAYIIGSGRTRFSPKAKRPRRTGKEAYLSA